MPGCDKLAFHTFLWFILQAAKLLEERAASIARAGTAALRPSPSAEYAELRLQLEFAASGTSARLPAASSLFRDKSLERLAPGSPALAAMKARIEKLEHQLFQGQRPALHPNPDPRLAEAVAALALFEIQRLESLLTRMAQQVCGSLVFFLIFFIFF